MKLTFHVQRERDKGIAVCGEFIQYEVRILIMQDK
jgi:hypothetical protein